MHLDFGTLSKRLLQVEELVCARRGGYRFNLIVEKIVEVGRVQGPAAGKQFLLEAGFKGASAFGQQSPV